MTQTKIVIITCSVFALTFFTIVGTVLYLRWKKGNQHTNLKFRQGLKEKTKSRPIPEARKDSKVHFVPPYLPSMNPSYPNHIYNFNKQVYHI